MPIVAQNASRMDRRISLRYPIRSRLAAGGVAETWVEVGGVWAQWLPRSSREFYAAQAKMSDATGVFVIRHRTDIDHTWRIVNGDDLFEVIGVEEVGRRDALNVTARALNQTPGSAPSVLNPHDGADSFVALHDGQPVALHPAA